MFNKAGSGVLILGGQRFDVEFKIETRSRGQTVEIWGELSKYPNALFGPLSVVAGRVVLEMDGGKSSTKILPMSFSLDSPIPFHINKDDLPT